MSSNMPTCSAILILERKASVGPCCRRGIPYAKHSGITISLPKKSINNINHISDNYNSKSGICITISKKCITDEKAKPKTLQIINIADNAINIEKDVGAKMKDSRLNYCTHFRGKLDNFCGRLKQAFHM